MSSDSSEKIAAPEAKMKEAEGERKEEEEDPRNIQGSSSGRREEAGAVLAMKKSSESSLSDRWYDNSSDEDYLADGRSVEPPPAPEVRVRTPPSPPSPPRRVDFDYNRYRRAEVRVVPEGEERTVAEMELIYGPISDWRNFDNSSDEDEDEEEDESEEDEDEEGMDDEEATIEEIWRREEDEIEEEEEVEEQDDSEEEDDEEVDEEEVTIEEIWRDPEEVEVEEEEEEEDVSDEEEDEEVDEEEVTIEEVWRRDVQEDEVEAQEEEEEDSEERSGGDSGNEGDIDEEEITIEEVWRKEEDAVVEAREDARARVLEVESVVTEPRASKRVRPKEFDEDEGSSQPKRRCDVDLRGVEAEAAEIAMDEGNLEEDNGGEEMDDAQLQFAMDAPLVEVEEGEVEAEVREVVEGLVQAVVAVEERMNELDEEGQVDLGVDTDDDQKSVSSTSTAVPLRRSQRVRRPVDRWAYPIDHIKRRRVARRNGQVQPSAPRRRPVMPLPMPVPVVPKPPRQLPIQSRNLAPLLPAPIAISQQVAFKLVDFADLEVELEKARKKASEFDFGNAGLELVCKIASLEGSVRRMKKMNAVPSPAQHKRMMAALAKVRGILAIQ